LLQKLYYLGGKMKVKWFIIIASVLAIVMVSSLSFAGCKAEEEVVEEAVVEETIEEGAEEELKIGALWCIMAAPSVKACSAAAEEEAEKLGVELISLDGELDGQKQVDQALNLISQKVDAIIVNPADASTFSSTAKQIYDAGIPFVTFIQSLDEEGTRYQTSAVVDNDIEFGNAYADKMAELLNGKGDIVLIEGALGSTPQIVREAAIIERIEEKYPDIEILDMKTTSWDRETARKNMEDFLAKYENIDGVMAWDDNLAIGVIEALRKVGKAGEVKIVSYVGMKDAKPYVESGEISATIFSPILEQARQTVRLCIDIVNGKEVEPVYYTPIEWITKDNISDFPEAFQY
jgi:ABC-type sugar transport system substrate-binding protein